ncbi:hypothetical protein PEC301877_19170 [Pectobacterium carotovorum subsp. carotovorum]|nr:hypothetical protein PEC301877_19170 [Pectobacterium carotovorum subsp. carotovorum]
MIFTTMRDKKIVLFIKNKVKKDDRKNSQYIG